MASESSIYYKPRWWTPPSPSSVFSWALTKTGLYSSTWKSAGNSPGSLKQMQYVSLSALETAATHLLGAIRLHQDSNQGFAGSGGAGSYTQTVYTKDLFYKLFHKISLDGHKFSFSTLDLDILLRYLSRDLPRISIKDDTIKVDISAKSFADITPVSEQDRAVANLRQTVHDVVLRIDGLSTKIEACDKNAKEALASKRSNFKTVTRYALRSRKLAQTTQESALDMLANLEQTLASIDNASSTIDIMTSLQQGVGILSSLNRAVGGAEKVAELVDELHDTMADTDEIGREIRSLAADVDEADLEDELEKMLKEELAKENKKDELSQKVEAKPEETSQIGSGLSVEEQLKSAPKPPQNVPKVPTEDLAEKLSQIHIS